MPKKKGLLLPFCPQTTFSPVVDIASLCHPNQRTQKREFATNRAINSHMEKSVRWLLFEYRDLELVEAFQDALYGMALRLAVSCINGIMHVYTCIPKRIRAQ